MFGSSQSIIINLSNPNAHQPWGGQPYWNASYIAQNLSFTSSSVLQTFSKTLTRTSVS
jgi:hypothetical protein